MTPVAYAALGEGCVQVEAPTLAEAKKQAARLAVALSDKLNADRAREANDALEEKFTGRLRNLPHGKAR